MYGENVNPEYK